MERYAAILQLLANFFDGAKDAFGLDDFDLCRLCRRSAVTPIEDGAGRGDSRRVTPAPFHDVDQRADCQFRVRLCDQRQPDATTIAYVGAALRPTCTDPIAAFRHSAIFLSIKPPALRQDLVFDVSAAIFLQGYQLGKFSMCAAKS